MASESSSTKHRRTIRGVLTYGGEQFAGTELVRIDGAPAVGYFSLRFLLRLTVLPRPSEKPRWRLTSVEGTVELPTAIGSRRVGRLRPIETLAPITAWTYPSTHDILMEVELDQTRLEAVEAIRLGAGLRFAVPIRAQLEIDGESVVVHDPMALEVNQGTWVENLATMGYAEIRLIEVPVLDSSVYPDLAGAVGDLTAARKSMHNGDWREAVGRCRDALESIGLELGDGDDVDPSVRHLFANTRRMSKRERTQFLRRALKLMTHPARHRDDLSKTIDWTRTDAVTLIAMVAATLQLAHDQRRQDAQSETA